MNLQESVYHRILRKNQPEATSDLELPNSTSITISTLWWATITISVSASLFVIVAKGMGSRVIDRSEARALGEARSVREFNVLLARPPGEPLRLSRADLSFAKVFELLVRTSTATITLALVLFYLGLVVLVYSANKGIGLGVASIAAVTTLIAVPCLVYYSRLWAGSQYVRVVESS
jgi:ABC-type uncharacterized transport system permease subunit